VVLFASRKQNLRTFFFLILRSIWGCRSSDFVFPRARGLPGGILTTWDKDVLQLISSSCGDFALVNFSGLIVVFSAYLLLFIDCIPERTSSCFGSYAILGMVGVVLGVLWVTSMRSFIVGKGLPRGECF